MMRKFVVLAFAVAMGTAMVARVEVEADWSQWRGPQRDGHAADTGLLHSWTGNGPRLLWQTKGLGQGYASLAIVDGRILTLGHRDGAEHLIAVSVRDGSPLWSLPFGTGDHSNGTPTVDGQRVYAISLSGDLVCADLRTGRELWRKNFERDFGGRMMSGWGYSESPLVDGDRLICTPGGKDSLLVALDKKTGQLIWGTHAAELGERGGDGAGYASIVVSEGAGVRQYVQLTGRGLVGVRAKDGRLLWHYNAVANDTANIPTPIAWEDYVFGSSGYGTGAVLLQLMRTGDNVEAREAYFLPASTFQNHHGGMVRVGDQLYAGHGHNNGFPTCLDLRTGKVLWGGKERGPGSGSAAVLYADGYLIFRYQDGVLALVQATPQAYRLVGQFKPAFQEGESWSHPVIVDGRLYLREQDVLMCYDLRSTKS